MGPSCYYYHINENSSYKKVLRAKNAKKNIWLFCLTTENAFYQINILQKKYVKAIMYGLCLLKSPFKIVNLLKKKNICRIWEPNINFSHHNLWYWMEPLCCWCKITENTIYSYSYSLKDHNSYSNFQSLNFQLSRFSTFGFSGSFLWPKFSDKR